MDFNGQIGCYLDPGFHMLVPDVLEAFSLNVGLHMVDRIILAHPFCHVLSQVTALGLSPHILRLYQDC